MRRLIAVGLAMPLLGIGGVNFTEAEEEGPTDPTPSTCDGHSVKFHRAQARGIARTMFAQRKWRDATPVRNAQQKYNRWHIGCVQHPGTRRAMRQYMRVQKRKFYRYRATGGPLTPYGAWAIPEYIVACESGGSWGAYNSSGARGPYQFLGWSVPWPVNSWSDKMAHHRQAAGLWAGGSGASHWTQCL